MKKTCDICINWNDMGVILGSRIGKCSKKKMFPALYALLTGAETPYTRPNHFCDLFENKKDK